MSKLCPYKDVLGKPGEGFHSARLLGLAQNDTLGTIGLAALTTYATGISFPKSLLGWFVLAEVSHYAFGVDTALLRMMNLSPRCESATDLVSSE